MVAMLELAIALWIVSAFGIAFGVVAWNRRALKDWGSAYWLGRFDQAEYAALGTGWLDQAATYDADVWQTLAQQLERANVQPIDGLAWDRENRLPTDYADGPVN